MTDEFKKKGPSFDKPKEPEAVPSKAPRPAVKAEVSSSKERPRPIGGVITTKEKPRIADGSVVTSTRPRSVFAEPGLAAVDALECEALAICLCSDVRPLAGITGYVDWRLCGRISDLLRKGLVTGAAGEKVLVPTLGRIGPKRLFLFGWGPQKNVLEGASERFAWMVDVLVRADIERVAIALPEPAVALVGLVDDHLRKALGDKCAVVFGPDQLLLAARDVRPIALSS